MASKLIVLKFCKFSNLNTSRIISRSCTSAEFVMERYFFNVMLAHGDHTAVKIVTDCSSVFSYKDGHVTPKSILRVLPAHYTPGEAEALLYTNRQFCRSSHV